MGSSRLRVGAGIVVFVAAALAVYFAFVSVDEVQTGRLSQLVVSKPPAGFKTKPAAANAIPASSSQFAEVKAAGKRSPHATGSYSIEWSDATSGGTNAVSLVVSVLPSATDAAKVQSEAKTTYLAKTSLKAESYTYAGAVTVASIPRASAAFFTPSSLTNPPLVVVAFQTGRAQATEFIGIPGAKQSIEAEAVSFAHAEYEHLRGVLPGFSLVKSTRPLVATIVYWIIVALIVAAAVVGPPLRRRAKQRRLLAAERARLQHMTVRGSKIAKRQAARRR